MSERDHRRLAGRVELRHRLINVGAEPVDRRSGLEQLPLKSGERLAVLRAAWAIGRLRAAVSAASAQNPFMVIPTAVAATSISARSAVIAPTSPRRSSGTSTSAPNAP
jgi:hypothetical protein